MNTAYLILGGNKGDKKQNLHFAYELINKNVGEIIDSSDLYETQAWGNINQPNFLNQALKLQTELSGHELLAQLLLIEKELGRVRDHQKWMERTIDIDILFFNDEIIDTPDLKIPHPFIQERKFVLAPMAQIAPELKHPVLNKTIKVLLAECKDELQVNKCSKLKIK